MPAPRPSTSRLQPSVSVESESTAAPRRRFHYVDPANTYVARFGSPLSRAVAATIDWGLCWVGFVLVSIPLGIVQGLGALSWREGDFGGTPGHILFITTQLLTLVPVVAYFTLLLPTSQTFGMRFRELRAVSISTGAAPSSAKALIRGGVATLLAAAVYTVFQYRSSFERPSHLDTLSVVALDAAYVLAAFACLSALIMVVTPTHRSLVDRVFGMAVLDELEAVVPHMGPWGALDAFDLSNRRS